LRVAGDSQSLVSIQVLRGVAALMVAFAHFHPALAELTGTDPPIPNFVGGAFGVDLFFVISGFVILYSSEPLFGRHDGTARFFLKRLVRIVPLYAAVTIVAALLSAYADPKLLIASLTFWPFPPGDVPALAVGWTLNVEMMFYAVFAAALFLVRSRLAVALTATAALLGTMALPGGSWTSVFGQPLVWEFVFGMALALAYRVGLRLPLSMTIAMLGLALLLYVLSSPAIVLWSMKLPDSQPWIVLPRQWSWGPVATLVVGALALSSTPRPVSGLGVQALAGLVLIGDASYALYLVHYPVYELLGHALTRLALDPFLYPWTYVAAMGGLALVAAILAHFFFERPLTRHLHQKITLALADQELGAQPVASI